MTNPRVRKLLLTVHVGSSVGWLGAIVAYIALNIPALASDDEQLVRAAYLMMEQLAWFALVPLSVAALLSGIVQSLVSPWGLFRHYWVVISLVMTTAATLVLLLHLPAIGDMADTARGERAGIDDLGGDLFHSVGGLAVLLVPLVLNIYKPHGLTRYGWRVQQRQRKEPRRSGGTDPRG